MLAKGLIKSVWQPALLFTFVSRETLTWMASPSTGSVRTVKPLQSSVAWTLDIGHNYVDQSISASKKNVARPDYDAMVASFERGEIDAIICWDLELPAPRRWVVRSVGQNYSRTTA